MEYKWVSSLDYTFYFAADFWPSAVLYRLDTEHYYSSILMCVPGTYFSVALVYLLMLRHRYMRTTCFICHTQLEKMSFDKIFDLTA